MEQRGFFIYDQAFFFFFFFFAVAVVVVVRHIVYILDSCLFIYFRTYRNILLNLLCDEMELLRTFLIVIVIGIRVGESTFDTNNFSDGFTLTCISSECKQTIFSYGHLTFYQHFVSINQPVVKTQKLSVSHRKRHNLVPVFLLLCGDVHPCPGPMDSQFASMPDYKCFEKKGLHFIHVNTRSLLPKIDELRILARQTNTACLCISETWLDDTIFDSEIRIDNYTVRRNDRNRQGGGVCMYIRRDLAFNAVDELSHDIEATWIELLLPKTKPIVCGVVYRPPDQTNFYELFESLCLDSALFDERECVVLGDLNTNMLGNRRCNLVKSLSAFLDLFNWTQIIKDPTRVTTTTSSTIDLILVSDIDKISQSGVINIGISDHSLIFCTRKQTKAVFNNHNSVKLRSLKHYNREEFQMNLLNTDWTSDVFRKCH